MRYLRFMNNMRVSYKLIGAFFTVAFLSGVVGIYSIFQINTLGSTVTEIIEVNVEQADYAMEITIDMKTQLITIHAAMLGETDMLADFAPAYDDITQSFTELMPLMAGTLYESSVASLESKYQTYVELANGSNGVFESTEKQQVASQRQKDLYFRIDELLDKLDGDFSTLEELVVDYAVANLIPVNYTLVDNAMELNLLLWRCGDRARMYMATELNNSAEHTALRQTLREEYADSASILNESSFVQSGLEKEFTDLMNEAETNFAEAVIAGQANVTMTLLLSEAKSKFLFDEEQDDNFATAIRCQEDGVFVIQDDLVAKKVIAENAMNQADAIGEELVAGFQELEIWVEEQLDLAAAHSKQIFADSLMLITAFAIFAIVGGITIGILMSRSITKPLDSVVGTSSMVAERNLSIDLEHLDLDRKDEVGILGKSVSAMVESLHSVISAIQLSAEQVATSSEELASTSEEVNAASEEIAATIQQVSRGASDQSNLSVKAMEEINKMSEVVDSSLQQIENVLQIIEDIAGQTNILALNAAIEAARAGEYGRGFAVVADNVRRLAEETKVNSSDISSITKDVVVSLGASVMNLQETLQNFASQSEEFSASSEQVSAATEEQTAAMHQMTSAAQDLTKLGEELSQEVAQFILPERIK
ncbi:MAG: methyl-accepting chemotaxis protein [Candidatus Hodarchaeales archaeon]